jgi:hypothetical protein
VRREVSDAATASRIGSEALDVVQAYSLFDGRDPTIFATTPDNPVRYVSDGGGYARISSSASSPGVKAIIGPGLAERLAGQRVRVTLLARSSTDFGAGAMRFAYQSGRLSRHRAGHSRRRNRGRYPVDQDRRAPGGGLVARPFFSPR